MFYCEQNMARLTKNVGMAQTSSPQICERDVQNVQTSPFLDSDAGCPSGHQQSQWKSTQPNGFIKVYINIYEGIYLVD